MATKTITYKGFTPHPGQARIIKEIFRNDTFFNTIVCPRQFGKSIMGANLMLYYAINNNNYTVVWAAPIHPRAKSVMEIIYKAIGRSGIVKEYNRTERRITLINGSKMLFTGTEKAENLRGLSIHILFIDETAYCDEKAITDVLIPAQSTVGKKAFFLSTPKGKHNIFYRLYSYGIENKSMYSSYRGTVEENPFRNKKLIKSEIETKPSFVIRQEYGAEFLDSEFTLFKNLDELSCLSFKEPSPFETYYAGIDWGRADDYTVCTILNSVGDVVYVYRDRQKSWGVMVDTIIALLKKYNNAAAFSETNSIGDVIFELIKKRYENVHPFGTYNNKQQLIESLMVSFETKQIRIPKKEIFTHMYNELGSFEFNYNPKTRKVTYSAPTGMHDDCVMSLAIANECKNSGFVNFKPMVF